MVATTHQTAAFTVSTVSDDGAEAGEGSRGAVTDPPAAWSPQARVESLAYRLTRSSLHDFNQLKADQPEPAQSREVPWNKVEAVWAEDHKLARLAGPRLPQAEFQVLQQWEGEVTAISRDRFTAIIRDRTNRSQPDEEVELPVEEVSPDDRALLELGAVFYWNIGRERTAYGQVKRVSEIRFRRLPMWTKQDLRAIESEAKELRKLFRDGE